VEEEPWDMISEVEAEEEDFNRRDHCLTGAVVAAAAVTFIVVSFLSERMGGG